MKISQKGNQTAITNIRSQIIESADLEKFNSFLAKYDVIDFADAQQRQEMDGCCGGQNCCQHVEFTTTIQTN